MGDPATRLVSRLVIGGLITVLVIAVAGAILLTRLSYGSSSAPDPAGLLAIQDPAEVDLDGDGEAERLTYVYRHDLGISLMTLASIRNDGPLPVTIQGVGPPPVVPPEHSSLVWAERLVDSPWPAIVSPDPTLPFSPTTLAPGAEDAFWVVWRTGSGCTDGFAPFTAGSSTITADLVFASASWDSRAIKRSRSTTTSRSTVRSRSRRSPAELTPSRP